LPVIVDGDDQPGARSCRQDRSLPTLMLGTDPGWTAWQVSAARRPLCCGHIWLAAKAARMLPGSRCTD